MLYEVITVVADGGAHRVTGDCHALDDRVRVEPQDVAILEGARLALVRVTGEVFVAGERTGHEAPLQTGGETRTTTPAQHRRLHLGDDACRRRLFSYNFV